jgi:hypothetical protein
VTEIVSQEKNQLKAISVVATSDRQLHLYTVEYPNDQNRAISKPLGKYFINMNTLKETMADDQQLDMNTNNFVLNNMFLIPEMNNRLIMIYVAVNTGEENKTCPRIDMLINFTEIRPENKDKEDLLRDKYYNKSKNASDVSTADHLMVSCFDSKNRVLPSEPLKAHEAEDNMVLGELKTHRLTFNDRDALGPDWMNTKILVSDVKAVDNKICMMISSSSLKIQEMVILEGCNLTHYNIKDETNQGIASVDSLQVWHSKSESTLHFLTQSITDQHLTVRDLSFDIKLKDQMS